MDTTKIDNYDKIAGTFRSGLLTPESTIAQGAAPHTVGFTSGANGTDFVQEESGWMTLIPTIYMVHIIDESEDVPIKLDDGVHAAVKFAAVF